MSRVASHVHQAGEGSAAFERNDADLQIQQPVDPFEEIPRGVSDEEVGFGSLAFEDRVIVERGANRRRPASLASRQHASESIARPGPRRAFAGR